MNIPYSEVSFIESAANGDMMAVKLFLAAGMNVNAGDGDALGKSAEQGRIEVVKTLLDAGADINKGTPLNGIAYDMTKVKLLTPFTRVIMAVTIDKKKQAEYTEIIKLLLDKGADSNSKKPNGWSVLAWAAKLRNAEIVKLLLDKGADPNSKEPEGWSVITLVTYPINLINAEIIKLLLDKGADPNSRDPDGWSLLALAAGIGNAEIVKLLLDKGADSNSKEPEWGSVLAMTIAIENAEIVKLLHNAGAATSGTDIVKSAPQQPKSPNHKGLGLKEISPTFLHDSSSESESAVVRKTVQVPQQEVKAQSEDQQTIQAPAVPIHKQGDTYTLESINLDNGTNNNTTERKVVLANAEKVVVESRNLASKSAAVRQLEFTPEWNVVATRNADGSGLNYSPPLKYYEFPLTSGKTWQQIKYRDQQ